MLRRNKTIVVAILSFLIGVFVSPLFVRTENANLANFQAGFAPNREPARAAQAEASDPILWIILGSLFAAEILWLVIMRQDERHKPTAVR